jgi:hypothetical protein
MGLDLGLYYCMVYDNKYTGNGGNNKVMQLVIDGFINAM